jgi:membrane protein YqaA with SNARE-associated domain
VLLAADRSDKKKHWLRRYWIIITGVLLSALIIIGIVIWWDEMQDTSGYGYAGCFLVSVMAGITITPAPALPVVFTLGHKLNPLYVGLVAGFGEALGGLTVYLTGAGGKTIWSKLRARQKANQQANDDNGDFPLVAKGFQSRQRAFFERVVAPMRRWGSFWPVFIASAMLASPFYFVGLGAGALHTGLHKFFLVSLAGKTLKGMYVAFAGYFGLYFLLKWIGG